jgi:opacity protein-like surface antigen
MAKMQTKHFILLAFAVATVPTAARAEEIVTNRLSASLRFGLNIKGRFKGNPTLPPGPTRTTPNGDRYNYEDGYVLTDSSGNAGGQTWYWGYNNSAGQISDGVAFPANTILLSRSSPDGSYKSPELDDDPHLGFEITYDRHLFSRRRMNFGLEFGANYLNIGLQNRSSFSTTAQRTTDAYAYTPGTTPPAATPANPYRGSFDGFGFLIGDTPVASSSAAVAGGYTVSGSRELDANLWGGRLGPSLDYPITDRLNLWISAGLALGLLNADASWNETISLGTSSVDNVGRGSDSDFLLGWYLGGNISWDITQRWSVLGGVQFQDLGRYSHNFGGRTAELDLSKSIFINIGASYRF